MLCFFMLEEFARFHIHLKRNCRVSNISRGDDGVLVLCPAWYGTERGVELTNVLDIGRKKARVGNAGG